MRKVPSFFEDGVVIPSNHPRAESLEIRELLKKHVSSGVLALSGLFAHGRGEAFDYLLGEETIPPSREATIAAVAALLQAQKPVISINGNTAALASKEFVTLSKVVGAKLEVNLFYDRSRREFAVERFLKKAGAENILGVGRDASAVINEVWSERRRVDPRGMLIADVVLVSIEDGDRTEALRRMGKLVIAIDLNPLSRTARAASITIVDHIIRAAPKLVETAVKMKNLSREELSNITKSFDNQANLRACLLHIRERLERLSKASGAWRLTGK